MIRSEIRSQQPTLVAGTTTLPGICQALHEAVTGSGEGWSTEKVWGVVHFLARVSNHWEPTVLPQYLRYDDAVKELVSAAINEGTTYLNEQGRKKV